MQSLTFLLKWITIGLALAFLVVLFRPDFLPGRTEVVEIVGPGGGQGPTHPVGNPTATTSYSRAVELAAPAVVNIFSRKIVTEQVRPNISEQLLRQFLGSPIRPQTRQRVERGLGSGVIISPQGYLLTNNHVISGAEVIQVLLSDGRSAEARIIGTDAESDIAVLKIDLPDLPVVTIGNSRVLQVGDIVLAIGNPFGVGQTVTMGIVSATGRNQLGINTFEDFIQTDAAINPGNSGGALINPWGELIGINTAIYSRTGGSQGIGFAIPVQLAEDIMRQIVQHGRVIRGWVGVEAAVLNPEFAKRLGLEAGIVVERIYAASPAARAGLKPGDIITHLDDQLAIAPRSLLARVAQMQPGSSINLRVIRDGEKMATRIVIAERPPVLADQ